MKPAKSLALFLRLFNSHLVSPFDKVMMLDIVCHAQQDNIFCLPTSFRTPDIPMDVAIPFRAPLEPIGYPGGTILELDLQPHMVLADQCAFPGEPSDKIIDEADVARIINVANIPDLEGIHYASDRFWERGTRHEDAPPLRQNPLERLLERLFAGAWVWLYDRTTGRETLPVFAFARLVTCNTSVILLPPT